MSDCNSCRFALWDYEEYYQHCEEARPFNLRDLRKLPRKAAEGGSMSTYNAIAIECWLDWLKQEVDK